MPSILSGACFQQSLTRRNGIKLGLSAVFASFVQAAESTAAVPEMTANIPSRSPVALKGSEFVEFISGMDRPQREQAILTQILDGNLPSFLRKLVPVRLGHKAADGKTLAATIFVMPEYLAIGSDTDFLRIPMNLHTATAIADRFRCVLPTRKVVDAVYEQSTYHFAPQPMQAGPGMTSTQYYRTHNEMIEQQARERGFSEGALVAGHKKDVVISNRLATRPTQIAIYGWHRGVGAPIQPLSTVHGAGYADYSHGIRLVSETVMIHGKPRWIYDILRDSSLAQVLSDEGSISVAAALGHA